MGYRILYLDDNMEHLDALKEACLQGGHEIVPMQTIAASMDWLNHKDHVDVIVSTPHLEHESVFDFLIAVKENPRHSWVQFVMLSTNQSELAQFLDDNVKRAAKILGADKYVVMDAFCPNRLLKEVEAACPSTPPQKDLDPVRDALEIPRPSADLPKSVDDAQRT